MSVELSSSFSSDGWNELKNTQDKLQIVTVLRHRYTERYFEPFRKNEAKHGFSMMAVSCLVIESFISLSKGWKKTRGKGGIIFESFFANSNYLNEFTGLGQEFYTHIRCGILHQAETTNGWRIRRDDSTPLVCSQMKVINATKFMAALNKEIQHFLSQLEELDFTSAKWTKVIKKIDHIVNNCG